jgi:recombination protein RecR
MMRYPLPLAELIEAFARLPGIGRKTAQRLAFHIIADKSDFPLKLSEAILNARSRIGECSVCYNITEDDPCVICSDQRRDHGQICVVESARDLMAIEKTGEYSGVYHVLGGVISPMEGIGPDEIRLKELIVRVRDNDITEVILATNPTVEGEATSMYISKLLSPAGINVTRLAHGIPVGGDIEYVDEVTIMKALEGRRKVK